MPFTRSTPVCRGNGLRNFWAVARLKPWSRAPRPMPLPLRPRPKGRVCARRATWVATNARQLAVVALPPVAVSAFLLGVTSEHLVHPRGASAYWTYLVVAPVLVGLLWWRRRPASRLGPLLVALGYMSWPLSWQGSDVPLDLQPRRRRDHTADRDERVPLPRLLHRPAAKQCRRRLLAALVFVLALFFGASLLLSPTLVGEGRPLATCPAACPHNPFQVGSAPGLLEGVAKFVTYVGLAIVAGRRSGLAPAFPGSDATAAADARPRRRDLGAPRAVALRLLLLRARDRGG